MCVEHPSSPPEGATCSVLWEDIDGSNYFEYRVATAEGVLWFAASVCDQWAAISLLGVKNKFIERLEYAAALFRTRITTCLS